MGIKEIKNRLKKANIKADVKYLGNDIRKNGYCIHESTCMYSIQFPKIENHEYWDEPIEVIDEFDAGCEIEDYLKDLSKTKNKTT